MKKLFALFAALMASLVLLGQSSNLYTARPGEIPLTGIPGLTTSVTARAALANATAASAAPAFSTTMDVLAYQVAEIPSNAFVASTFTTSGSGTALETITGLTWTMPGTTALNIPFSCHIIYHQNTAAVAVAFGIQDVTTAPTQINAHAVMYTNTTAATEGNLVALASTTATAIVSATPSAITTNWVADIYGFIEQPSGTASLIRVMTSTATAADTVSVIRGSFCRMGI